MIPSKSIHTLDDMDIQRMADEIWYEGQCLRWNSQRRIRGNPAIMLVSRMGGIVAIIYPRTAPFPFQTQIFAPPAVCGYADSLEEAMMSLEMKARARGWVIDQPEWGGIAP